MGRTGPAGSASRRSPRSRVLIVLGLAYLTLLGFSHHQRGRRAPRAPDPGQLQVTLKAIDGDRRTDEDVQLVYREHGVRRPDRPTVLLLHGSPGDSSNFTDVAEVLGEEFHVIVPDLPGFGSSSSRLPDYSIRAHAGYARDLLDQLELTQVHAVGFSMGGGVGLELYDLDPSRLASLTMLAAIGAQEFEWLGSYRLNHLVHGAQLAGLWLLHEGVPHMGTLDNSMLSLAYARNFYDSDQRPLRGILERFEPPLLILHGRRDFLVSPQTAVEHARVVPQSELQMLDVSHFMVFARPEPTARRLADFFERVDAGAVPSRARAAPERVAAAARPFDPSSVPTAVGLLFVVLLVLIALATLVSEDLACIGAGLLVAQGRLEFLPAVLAAGIGILVGDLAIFLAGRWIGRPALRRAPLRWLMGPARVDAASAWFCRRGPLVILFSRFLPGARLATYFAAGSLHTGFWAFLLYFVLAVVAWTPLLVGASVLFGESMFGYAEWFERHSLVAFAVLGAWVLLVLKVLLPSLTHRGRRGLVGAWRRIWRWEFWPAWLFYLPVIGRVAWLGLRYRSPLLFTAVNPGMPASGFVFESKSDILDSLAGAGEFVARTQLISVDAAPAERHRNACSAMEQLELEFPVVLKPDVGQRGSGVAIARSDSQLQEYLSAAGGDTLIQEFVPGAEYGLFYYRLPDEPRGRLFSVTEKKLPVLTGDGRRSVEQLILDDDRAVCLADHYLARQAIRLGHVPAAGEPVNLVDLGTHCRGAIFLDGSHVVTPALEDRVDEISRGVPGFFFGRYDVRVPDEPQLAQGRGFKILELNGVASEATHIYDPRLSLGEAYRTLFEQWEIAFRIGEQNRRQGVRPVGLRTLLQLLRSYRQAARGHPGAFPMP